MQHLPFYTAPTFYAMPTYLCRPCHLMQYLPFNADPTYLCSVDYSSISVSQSHMHKMSDLKGQCHEIFCFWFFSSICFPPAPECPSRTVSNFFENSRRYSQLKVDHQCSWHRWQMRKIFNKKNFNNFIGTPLDSRVNAYIHFCLQVHFKLSPAWY